MVDLPVKKCFRTREKSLCDPTKLTSASSFEHVIKDDKVAFERLPT